MMKALVAGLLAAAAVVPAVAVAQDASLREAFRQRMEARGNGDGGERPARGRADGERGGRDANAPGGSDQRADRDDRGDRGDRSGRAERPVVDARANAGGWQRPDRPERGARPDPVAADAQANIGGGWQRGERGGTPAGGWNRGDRQRADAVPQQRVDRGSRDDRAAWDGRRNDDRRVDARRDRDQRVDWNRDRDQRAQRDRDWNANRGGWDQRDRNWNDRNRQAGQWNRAGQWGQGSQWNREWRRDPRYDWNRYRTGNRSAYRLPRYYAPYGWNRGYQRFSIGVRLSSVLFAQDYWIDDPYSYRLPEVDGPYRWVRYYDDALLVDIYTGQVVDVVNDMFWQG